MNSKAAEEFVQGQGIKMASMLQPSLEFVQSKLQKLMQDGVLQASMAVILHQQKSPRVMAAQAGASSGQMPAQQCVQTYQTAQQQQQQQQ